MKRTVKYVLLLSGVVPLGIAALMWLPGRWLKAQQTSAVPGISQPYNIIFVVSDQEADHLLATGNFELPARDELKRRGIVLQNHYIASAMCSPSRAAFLSGQPPQVNGVFDQIELGYVPKSQAG